jgi:endonuclease YncB( thermonuclease family)
MQKLKHFWQRDLLNKLIVLALLLIVTALVADLVFILARRSSAERLLADLFPTPTLPLSVIQTQNAATAEYESAMATASVPPTMTTMHFDMTQAPPTTTATQETPTPTLTLIGQPPLASSPAQTPSPTLPASTPFPLACLTNSPAMQGKVVDVVDGITVRVLIDGLVYTVRYIGVVLPEYEGIAQTAAAINGEMVYLKDVSLVGEGIDKDLNGRLLRYVILGDRLINLSLLQQGLVTVDQSASTLSCAQDFKQAEDAARAAQLGIWKIATAPAGP